MTHATIKTSEITQYVALLTKSSEYVVFAAILRLFGGGRQEFVGNLS